jgi:hypothetical protein
MKKIGTMKIQERMNLTRLVVKKMRSEKESITTKIIK